MNPVPEINSGINERLKEVSPHLNLSEAPPINQKRLVTFINHFLINIVDFLDKLSKHCTNKLLEFDQKLNRIEAELILLESKLNSIPEIADQEDVIVEAPNERETVSSQKEEPVSATSSDVKSEEVARAEEIEAKENKPEEQVVENPELIKFRKMIQVGVPLQAVKIKMQLEGFDPSLIDS